MPPRHPKANDNQRARRERRPRIDYYPSPDALALITSRRTRYGSTNNNSGILDTIIAEWAALAGLKQSEIDKPKCQAKPPELCEHSARTRMTSGIVDTATPELLPQSRARARARITSVPENKTEQARVICGARRRRDGQPCQALSVQGKRRCRWHGGCSTGPRTADGRVRSLANLRQYAGGVERG